MGLILKVAVYCSIMSEYYIDFDQKLCRKAIEECVLDDDQDKYCLVPENYEEIKELYYE